MCITEDLLTNCQLMEESAFQKKCSEFFFRNSIPWISWNSVPNSFFGTVFRFLLSEQSGLQAYNCSEFFFQNSIPWISGNSQPSQTETFPNFTFGTVLARNCSEFHFRNSVPWMSMEQTSNYKSAPGMNKDFWSPG